MAEITWTKETLAKAINTRVDQRKIAGGDFVMPGEITDDALQAWQEFYDSNTFNPFVIESEYTNLYQSIIAGF